MSLEVVRSNKTVEEMATVSGLSGEIGIAIILGCRPCFEALR